MQGATNGYILKPKMLAVVSNITDLATTLQLRINTGVSVVDYDALHPLYLQVKEFVCCKTVDMFGNLWLSMFWAGIMSIILLLAMCCYIRRLDELPNKR